MYAFPSSSPSHSATHSPSDPVTSAAAAPLQLNHYSADLLRFLAGRYFRQGDLAVLDFVVRCNARGERVNLRKIVDTDPSMLGRVQSYSGMLGRLRENPFLKIVKDGSRKYGDGQSYRPSDEIAPFLLNMDQYQ